MLPTDLYICGPDVSEGGKKHLLRETRRHAGPALLFCANGAALPGRILLIDQGGPFSDSLLEITLNLCEIFRAGLVVLTMARTEREARQRQRRAREILEVMPPHPALSPQGRGGRDLHVNFDFLAGVEVRSAAASVARWRHCQLVVLEPDAAWGRWLGFHSGSWITESLESLSFLVIPGVQNDARSRLFHADSSHANANSSHSPRLVSRTRNDESAERPCMNRHDNLGMII